MYKFTKEIDGELRTVMSVGKDANIEDMLLMFKYFLLASGFVISEDEEVVVFRYDSKEDLIGDYNGD